MSEIEYEGILPNGNRWNVTICNPTYIEYWVGPHAQGATMRCITTADVDNDATNAIREAADPAAEALADFWATVAACLDATSLEQRTGTSAAVAALAACFPAEIAAEIRQWGEQYADLLDADADLLAAARAYAEAQP